MHDHEVPGHGPTVILSHLDGDEPGVPNAVEQRLRAGRQADDDDGDESPAAMAPIYTAVALAVCTQVLVTVLLVALRVGGALDWSWGWTLAPLWVPSTVATVLVVVIGIVLAAMDEREAAHRRRHA